MSTVSPISSAYEPIIAPAVPPQNREAVAFSPPLLAPPLEQRLANLDTLLRKTKKNIVNLQVDQMDYSREKLAAANQARIEQLRKSAQDVQSRGFWTFLSNIASFVLSTLSIVTGIGHANPVIGGCLIAIGVISIANAILSDNGGWDWLADKLSGGNEEARVFLRNALPGIVAILLFGVSLTSGVLSWDHVQTKDQILSLIATLSATVSGVATIGKSQAQGRVIWNESEQARFRVAAHDIQTKVDTIGREIEQHMAGWKRTSGNLGKMIHTHLNVMDQLMRKV